MKKYFSLLMCFALVSFVACDGGDDPNDDGPDTGTPPTGTRLVEKIVHTYEETNGVDVYSGTSEILFTYDAQNRVTKVEMTADEMEEGEYYITTISYGTGTVTAILKEGWWGGNDDVDPGEVEVVRAQGFLKDRHPAGIVSKTRSESENDVFVEKIATFTYTLNADGYLSTGTSEWKKSNVITESGTIAFTYNNGFISKYFDVSEDHDKEITTTFTTDYTWSSNGNLTKAVSKGDNGDYDWENEYVMTYGAAVNPTGVNFDINYLVCPVTVGDDFLNVFGFCGKSSKNLLSAYETEWSEATVKWETDANGFVTKATREVEDYSWETKNTYTVTYKK